MRALRPLLLHCCTAVLIRYAVLPPFPYRCTAAQNGGSCVPSDLGYDCMVVTTGDVVAAVHWSYGSDSPPDNACTRGRSTTLASSSGFMHVAVEAPQAGDAMRARARGFCGHACVMEGGGLLQVHRKTYVWVQVTLFGMHTCMILGLRYGSSTASLVIPSQRRDTDGCLSVCRGADELLVCRGADELLVCRGAGELLVCRGADELLVCLDRARGVHVIAGPC